MKDYDSASSSDGYSENTVLIIVMWNYHVITTGCTVMIISHH